MTDWTVRLRALSRYLIVLLGAIALAVVVISWRAGSIYEYEDSFDGAELPDVDVICVLAGAKGRIAAGGDLWYRYYEMEAVGGEKKTPVLYISGMGPSSTFNTFALQLRAGIAKVIRPADAVLETESENTEANALFFMRNARLRGWKRMLLLTSPYHMKRSRMIFTRVMAKAKLPMEMKTHTIVQESYTKDEWFASIHALRVTVTEYLKWIYYSAFWDPV